MQHGAEVLLTMAYILEKIEQPKPFKGKSDDDINTWLHAMDLEFKEENHILQGQMALGVSWNLTADVSIWFRAKN